RQIGLLALRGDGVSVRESTFSGFSNPVDPRPEELQAWAYHPEAIPLDAMPPDWDLLLAGDVLAPTLFELAMDRQCPARRFAQHCMYIYAADGVRPNATSQPKRRLKKCVERGEEVGDEPMSIWAHNCRVLMRRPELFEYEEGIEGGRGGPPRRPGLFNRRWRRGRHTTRAVEGCCCRTRSRPAYAPTPSSSAIRAYASCSCC